MTSDILVRFTEADIESFTTAQENVNTKMKPSNLSSEDERREPQGVSQIYKLQEATMSLKQQVDLIHGQQLEGSYGEGVERACMIVQTSCQLNIFSSRFSWRQFSFRREQGKISFNYKHKAELFQQLWRPRVWRAVCFKIIHVY